MSVTIENLTIAYGNTVAVDRITLTLPQGATGLLGPNGAGKSSLIKGILGLIPVQEGRITIFGKDARAERKTIRRFVGYMPEEEALIPGLTGLEYVRYLGELSGMSSQDAMQRAHEVLFYVGLDEARYRKVETYSQGMKQRIKFAQALVHEPRLLFLDEPTSGLDPKGRQEMLELIRDIARRRSITLLLSTHILHDVENTCDQVVILHQGHVKEVAPIGSFHKEMTRTYTVRIEEPREPFEIFLKEKGCTVISDEKQAFDVTLPEGLGVNILFLWAEEAGVTIRKCVPAIQTLEDLFIKRLAEEPLADR